MSRTISMLKKIKHQSLLILILVPMMGAESATNMSETISTSLPDISKNETKDQSDSQEIKIDLPDIESLNKYRRNGMENDYQERWEDERRRHMYDLPERQYEDDFFPNYRSRFTEKLHPIRIQNCGHYSRDVSHDEGVIRSGILQGWLGAARAGNRNEDKRLDMSPFFVTTATPKTAPTYRNQGNKQNEYDSYDRQNDYNLPSKPKYNNNYRVKGSASKDIYNFQGNYGDDRNIDSWQMPRDKNNRVVYYEYNLDERRPEFGYGQDHYSNAYDQCENEYDDNRKPNKNQFKNRYPTTSIYGSSFIPQSKLSTSFNQVPNEKQYSSYYSDMYQSRNIDRGDARNYDFNLPLTATPNTRFQYPVQPTYLPQPQFTPESVTDRQDKNDVKAVPYGHRFNFPVNNF